MKKLFSVSGLIALASLAGIFPVRGQDGLYADFITSMGSFTCRLEYATAPKAVANFVGLATGQKAWLDSTGNVVSNKFYDGLLIHRVATNIVIQSGSPTGLPAGNPGYLFTDEFHPSLRFDSFGMLAMANSGPDSNGSQFFLSMGSRPDWNDNYTIFGRVIGGSNVLYAINHVATDAGERPLNDVVIQSVNIRRMGAAAQAFDIHSQNLPIVTGLNLKIAREGGNVSLVFSNRLFADNRFYFSTNLQTWTSARLGIELAMPLPDTLIRSIRSPKEFFRMAQVQYPSSTFSPKNLSNRTLALTFDDGSDTLNIAFNSSGGGSFTLGTGSGTVTSYVWSQEPYRGYLSPILFSNLDPIVLRLDFQSLNAGSFSGTVYVLGTFPVGVGGNFSLSAP